MSSLIKEKGNGFFSSSKDFFLSRKGFLFTISVIFFASTLFLFSQAFSERNLLDERLVISSVKPLSALFLVDDVGSDLLSLFNVSFDLNEATNSSVVVSGSIPSSNYVSSALTNYSSFSTRFFSRIPGSQSLDLSRLSDGKAEFFLSSSLEFDYNFSSNKIVLFPRESVSLTGIDLNIAASSDLTGIEYTDPGSGSVAFSFNYRDDSNVFSFSDSIDPSQSYVLRLIYADGNAFVLFGTISGTNGSVSVQAKSSQRLNYVLKNTYSGAVSLRPVKVNAFLANSFDNFDSNALIVLKK